MCACGTERRVLLGNVLQGLTRSCGCLAVETIRANALARVTHGMSRSPEHVVWGAMKSRCSDPNQAGWKHYGGRGITVCARWRDDFAAFYADMGPRPTPAHSIDRIDNEGNYEPGNCRWATGSEQARNTRRTLRLLVDGHSVPAVDVYAQHGVSRQLYSLRVANGWAPLVAATTRPHASRTTAGAL